MNAAFAEVMAFRKGSVIAMAILLTVLEYAEAILNLTNVAFAMIILMMIALRIALEFGAAVKILMNAAYVEAMAFQMAIAIVMEAYMIYAEYAAVMALILMKMAYAMIRMIA